MKLLSYKAIRSGIQALGSYSVRIGTKSDFSHTEVMFEPGDGVEDLVPDGILDPINGEYWCASATASDTMPVWSKRRAGRTGGVRWKRIKPEASKWFIQDLKPEVFSARKAAQWFYNQEGYAYDWRNIMSFISVATNWAFGSGEKHFTCAGTAAAALGFAEHTRFHPGNLPPVIARMIQGFTPDKAAEKLFAGV